MSKVLSIELGYSLVRVLEIDYKSKKPKIYANFEFKTPENVLEDGFIKQPEELGNALRAQLESHALKTKEVVFTISSARIASRDTTLPYVKENKLADLVMASAPDVFPVDVSNCKITYQILETQDSGDGNKKYHVALYAAPNDLLESYYTMCTIAGLKIMALDYSSNSFAIATQGVFANGTFMAVKVDDRSSLVSIFSEGKIAIQRTIPYGGDAAIEEIINLEEQESGDRVSYEKALGLLQMRSCIRSSIDSETQDEEDGNDERIKQFRMSIAETFTMFNSSIMRVIDYYNSRNSDSPVETVYVTGYAESFLGLTKLMGNELGIVVDRLSDRSSDIFSGLKEGGAYINCIGAAIDPMDFIPDKHSSKKKRKLGAKSIKGAGAESVGKATEKDYLVAGILVCLLGLIGAGALTAYTLMPYFEAEKRNKQLKQREAELAPVQEIYWQKVYSDKYLAQSKSMFYTTRNQNDNLLKFIMELEDTLPSTVNVTSFSSDASGITINLQVDSKDAAAKTIQDVRKFDTVSSVTVSGINETFNDLGGSIVSFTLNIAYTPVPFEDDAFESVAEDADNSTEISGNGTTIDNSDDELTDENATVEDTDNENLSDNDNDSGEVTEDNEASEVTE